MNQNSIRPPLPHEAIQIRSVCARMGLRVSTDDIRKVIYATDLVYYKTARAALAKEDKP